MNDLVDSAPPSHCKSKKSKGATNCTCRTLVLAFPTLRFTSHKENRSSESPLQVNNSTERSPLTTYGESSPSTTRLVARLSFHSCCYQSSCLTARLTCLSCFIAISDRHRVTDLPSLLLIAFLMIFFATSLRSLRLTVAAGAIPQRQSCFWVINVPASCLRPTSNTSARSLPESIAGKLPRSSVQILLRLEMVIFGLSVFLSKPKAIFLNHVGDSKIKLCSKLC